MEIDKYFPEGKGKRKSGKKLIERANQLRAAAGRPIEPRQDLAGPGRPIICNHKTGQPQLRGGQPSLTACFNIDPTLVARLAAQCYSDKEIAALIPCDVRTLRKHFAEELGQGRARLGARLKIRAYQMAMHGDGWMLRYLLERLDRIEERNARRQLIPRPEAPSLQPTKINSRRQTAQPRGLKKFQDEMQARSGGFPPWSPPFHR